MIVIVDYGLGNLGSVKKAIERIGSECCISDSREIIQNADKLILPGVGNFQIGMENLKRKGLIDLLGEEVLMNKKPVLGICLGMQLMTSFSEEGECQGLNWINAVTKRFPERLNLKVPHMGWNTLIVKTTHELFLGINEQSFFYFVHSYFVSEVSSEWVGSTTKYGVNFVSSFAKGNIYGCQFHPEKSHDDGLLLLRNFCHNL